MAHDVTPLGAHYLLTHYDIPPADAATWTLEVGGLVRSPLSLSLADLRARPAVSRTVTMECAGNGRARLSPRPVSQPWLHEAVGTMTWTGTPLAGVLADAAPLEGAVDVVFTGADHGIEKGVEQDYQRSLSVEHAADPEVLLVWACNGVDLPPQHGYPLRLLVPGWYGMASVKWLRSVEVVEHRFDGYQMRAYSLRQTPEEEGERLTRIAPRALVQPPGFPDFLSRRRVVRPGPQVLTGRAWSGWGEVVSVEVSVDGGTTWVEAELGAQPDPRAWRSWTSPVDGGGGAARRVGAGHRRDRPYAARRAGLEQRGVRQHGTAGPRGPGGRRRRPRRVMTGPSDARARRHREGARPDPRDVPPAGRRATGRRPPAACTTSPSSAPTSSGPCASTRTCSSSR